MKIVFAASTNNWGPVVLGHAGANHQLMSFVYLKDNPGAIQQLTTHDYGSDLIPKGNNQKKVVRTKVLEVA